MSRTKAEQVAREMLFAVYGFEDHGKPLHKNEVERIARVVPLVIAQRQAGYDEGATNAYAHAKRLQKLDRCPPHRWSGDGHDKPYCLDCPAEYHEQSESEEL